MRWWRRCWCCCWTRESSADERLLAAEDSFCIPRRSSFHTGDAQTKEDDSSCEEDHQGRCIPEEGSSSKVFFDRRRHILSEILEEESADDICGLITLTTECDDDQLRVFVEGASHLPLKSPLESYHTFVRMSLVLSSRSSARTATSRTVRNTLSPLYREDHVFHTSRSSKQKTYLKLSLFDCERQGRHDAVGHALLPLTRVSARKQKCSLTLTPMSIPTRKKNLGQVLLGLSYTPTQSSLSVQVVKAKHLTLDPDIHHRRQFNKDGGSLDTLVKVSLMCAGQKVKSNASRVVGGGGFYHFSSSFVLPPQFLVDASVVVSVLQVVRALPIRRRTFILGRCISGPYTEMKGTHTHWGKMAQQSGRNVVQWRNLYL